MAMEGRPFAITLDVGSSRANHTGTWRTERPVYVQIAEQAARYESRQHVLDLKQSLEGRKLIMSVDRLDYSKGLVERFHAFEQLLETSPEWRGKVTLVQIAPPTRSDVASYKVIREELEREAGRIAAVEPPVVVDVRLREDVDTLRETGCERLDHRRCIARGLDFEIGAARLHDLHADDVAPVRRDHAGKLVQNPGAGVRHDLDADFLSQARLRSASDRVPVLCSARNLPEGRV